MKHKSNWILQSLSQIFNRTHSGHQQKGQISSTPKDFPKIKDATAPPYVIRNFNSYATKLWSQYGKHWIGTINTKIWDQSNLGRQGGSFRYNLNSQNSFLHSFKIHITWLNLAGFISKLLTICFGKIKW